MDQEYAPASISNAFKTCISLFESLIPRLEGDNVTSWNDELGRLKIWGGNLGAHQTGQASLDHRLRNASHIRQNIVELLDSLCQALRDFEEVLTDPNGLRYNFAPSPMASDEDSEDESQQLHREVVSIIRDLFQMALLIRKPAHHSRLTEAQPSEISAYEPFDQRHVRDKFSKADETLIHRLGLAMTRRRKHLKYQERHHAKLSKGLEVVTKKDTKEHTVNDHISELSQTIATDFTVEDPIFQEESSRSVTSESSFASSFADTGIISIPDPPENSLDGALFECPYCSIYHHR